MRATSWGTQACLCAAAVALFTAVSAPGQIVINELLPDPAGSDAGHEFVELLNVGTAPVNLADWQLQFANGAEAADWQDRWRGQPGQELAPGARFLIVDRNWAGSVRGDAEAALALQNGPDAVRLVAAGVTRDLVGYGTLTDPALMETAPVPVVPGLALARRPDGHDSDDNRADFVAADPTPGAANFALHALTVVELAVEPPCLPEVDDAVTVTALLRNDGLASLPTTRVNLSCGPETVAAVLDAVASGEERRLAWTLRPQVRGQWPLHVAVPVAAGAETLRVDCGRLQVGPAALAISEVLAAPRSGQGEWLELVAAGPEPVRLGGHRVRDDDGDWVPLPALVLAAGSRLLAVQDSVALAGWLAANAGGPVEAQGCEAPLRQLSPWPGLNNSPPDGRTYADRVLLADSAGTVIDHVVIGEHGVEVVADRSLERVAGDGPSPGTVGWAECLAAAGATPGCRNSMAPDVTMPDAEGRLAAEPSGADRAAGQVAIHLSFTVPHGATGWDLTVFDLDGRAVRDLGGDGRGPGPRTIFWDLHDDHARAVPAGGYLAALQWRAGPRSPGSPPRCLLVVR